MCLKWNNVYELEWSCALQRGTLSVVDSTPGCQDHPQAGAGQSSCEIWGQVPRHRATCEPYPPARRSKAAHPVCASRSPCLWQTAPVCGNTLARPVPHQSWALTAGRPGLFLWDRMVLLSAPLRLALLRCVVSGSQFATCCEDKAVMQDCWNIK